MYSVNICRRIGFCHPEASPIQSDDVRWLLFIFPPTEREICKRLESGIVSTLEWVSNNCAQVCIVFAPFAQCVCPYSFKHISPWANSLTGGGLFLRGRPLMVGGAEKMEKKQFRRPFSRKKNLNGHPPGKKIKKASARKKKIVSDIFSAPQIINGRPLMVKETAFVEG